MGTRRANAADGPFSAACDSRDPAGGKRPAAVGGSTRRPRGAGVSTPSGTRPRRLVRVRTTSPCSLADPCARR